MRRVIRNGFVASPQPFVTDRDSTSKYCKLKSKYFIQRTENRKKFRINSKKDAHEYFEFICRTSVVIAIKIKMFHAEDIKMQKF